VSLATTSQEVLDLVAEDDSFFDAVVLDNWMPPTTGIETCKLIRIIDQKTPILFCSGAAKQSDIDEAKEAGAQNYLTKPFDPEELIKALQALITH
jgi:DNA-binding response OmpR family regulator